MAGEFADNFYRNDRPSSVMFSLNDGVGLMVDGDHSGGEYVRSLSIPEAPLHAQHYQAVSSVITGPRVALPLFDNPRWMLEPPFATAARRVDSEIPTFWTVEFFVTCFDDLNFQSPESSVISELAAGNIMGLNFRVIDLDEHRSRDARFYLADLPEPGYEGGRLFHGRPIAGPGPDGRGGRHLGPNHGHGPITGTKGKEPMSRKKGQSKAAYLVRRRMRWSIGAGGPGFRLCRGPRGRIPGPRLDRRGGSRRLSGQRGAAIKTVLILSFVAVVVFSAGCNRTPTNSIEPFDSSSKPGFNIDLVFVSDPGPFAKQRHTSGHQFSPKQRRVIEGGGCHVGEHHND